jgi:TonB family protein
MVKTILCLLLTSTGAFPAVDLSGSWSGLLERGGNKIPLYLTLTQSEDRISGTLNVEGATPNVSIEKPTLKADQLEFELHDSEGDTMRFRLVVTETRMTGEATVGDQVGRIQLEKTSPTAVFRVGRSVSAPVLIRMVKPEYTDEAIKAHLQGTVMLSVQIDANGRATNIRVTKPLGLGLDEKAVECVKKWKFKPGYKGDQPVTVEATIEVNFRR